MFNKKMLSLLLAFAMLLTFSACSESSESKVKKAVKPEKKSAGEVNLYTTRHYKSDDALYAKFEKETGIKVNVVNEKKAGALIEKIKSQGANVQADLFITADAGNLAKAAKAGILETVESKVLTSNIPEKYRGSNNEWFGLTKRARVMLYSKERVSKEDLNSLDYNSLVNNNRWNNKILIRSSSNIYNQSLVASFIELFGEEKATEWVHKLVSAMACKPEGNDRDQALAIKKGKGDIAISNSYYYGKLVNDKNPDSKYFGVADVVDIYFPNEDKNGVHVNISGIGLIKNAPHKSNAIKLMEFLSEVPQQEVFSATNYEFPVNKNAKMSALLKSWLDKQGITELNEQKIDLSKLGEHNQKAVEIMTIEKWDN
ncbi:MAG: Fe(3+) ABC transporter substrate-binding protein [Candidatus Cloacimonadota bacterium]|nr:MAG: Fe(3+) ABC transporter substrate-binding protein [Candidatus Cloacimonadota bacterium]PIE81638.1 MAG: Fe(3+) ABC transporter substrate-binding protein [Candidatus Delongbacteria bacterium]